MTGFNNPIVGGGGALVYPAIHSPNYVLNVTGWAIRKDGTAQFTNITLLGGTSAIRFLNSFGAVLMVVDPTAGGMFQYQDTGSAVQGPLIGAQSSKNTTDPVLATSVPAGIFINDPVFGDQLTVVGVNILFEQGPFTAKGLVTANTGSVAARPYMHVAAPEQGPAGHAVLRVYGKSPDGTKAGGVIISLTDPPVPVTAEALEVQGNLAVTLVKAVVAGAEETWHVVGSFLNSFSAGGTAPRYQLEPVGGGRVRLSGSVNTGAINAANTAMFNLPAGYRPARQLQFATPNNITAYTLGQPSVQVTTGGDVQLVPASTAGKFVVLDGICFELD